jgi:Tol biopolymer transport system component
LAFTPGTRLGPYEILSALGAGGMGEVYRARDTRLDRDVAMKLLPDLFASDAERLARFTREAQTLASLNHPNIAHIHGLEESGGVRALVMELVEGEDLSQRIARGAIPLEEALPIAKQIADGLEAAHEQGIIHRDLKPANIKVRPDGTVKVLDFGLAKLTEAGGAGRAGPADLSQSSTRTSPAAMTGLGVILGTAAYMSPEQARGKPLDKRTDIWAFGCVLYEMLTGRRTFADDEVSDVLAAVLTREPDLAALPVTAPPSIRRLLRRCLQKDRSERLRDIGDARIEIRDALSKADPEVAVAPVVGADRRRRERLAWIGALAALTLALAASLILGLRPSPAGSEMRVDIATPPTTAPLSLAISPDGRTIAFVATSESESRLWVRSLASASARPVVGTDGAEYPFWSPDSRSVGFFAQGQLRRVDVDGGSVQTLANVPAGQGGAWNRDDVILFASLGNPISRIPAKGGDPVAVSGLAQQGTDFSPQFLPGGRRFLYYVRGSPEVRGVYVGQLDETLEPRRLLDSDSGAVYASSGQLLFVRQGTLFAQDFDPSRLALTAGPFPVAERVVFRSGLAALSISAAGPIIYRTGSTAEPHAQWVWFDRSGREVTKVSNAMAGDAGNFPSMAPDGRRVALQVMVNGNADIWSLDTGRGLFSRFTSDAADDVMPIWSPDGSRIVFSSNRSGVHQLYQKSVTGAGGEELLLSTAELKFATDWSLDGRFLLYLSDNQKTGSDLWALPMNGDRTPFPVVKTTFNEGQAQFSPDGKWIAYQSNESGSFEIYVQPFPGPEGKSRISTNGGGQVRWRRDGKELFYIALDGRLIAIPVQLASSGQAVDVGAPVPLFAAPVGGALEERQQYIVSSDGQRFLMKAVTEEGSTSPITVILNWKHRP